MVSNNCVEVVPEDLVYDVKIAIYHKIGVFPDQQVTKHAKKYHVGIVTTIPTLSRYPGFSFHYFFCPYYKILFFFRALSVF